MTANLRFSVTHLLRAVLPPSVADRSLHALHVCSGCQIEERVDELDLSRQIISCHPSDCFARR